jgi:hypothetical protein
VNYRSPGGSGTGVLPQCGGTACGYRNESKPFFYFSGGVMVGEGFHIAFDAQN